MAAAAAIPPALKPITPFVLRGKEVLKGAGDEVVAYHCLKYALELGMKLPRTPEGQQFLLGLMDELERIKPHLAGRTKEDLKITCDAFAQQVFTRADSVDRRGEADRTTAQTFYAAASFLEMLKQFEDDEDGDEGGGDGELKEQILYAKFKAMDILKAVKEGRRPHPGPPPSAANNNEQDEEEEEHVPVAPAVVSPPPPPATATSSSPAPRPYVQPKPPPPPSNGGQVSKEAKDDALELIRFARAALEADDVAVAVSRLQHALARLT